MDSKMLQDNLHLAVVKERSPNRMSVEGARLVSLLFSERKVSSVGLKTGKQIHTSIMGDQDSTFSANLGTWTPVSKKKAKNKQRDLDKLVL